MNLKLPLGWRSCAELAFFLALVLAVVVVIEGPQCARRSLQRDFKRHFEEMEKRFVFMHNLVREVDLSSKPTEDRDILRWRLQGTVEESGNPFEESYAIGRARGKTYIVQIPRGWKRAQVPAVAADGSQAALRGNDALLYEILADYFSHKDDEAPGR